MRRAPHAGDDALQLRQPAVDLSLEAWDKVVAVNMTGTFLCSRAAARVMIARGGGGAIVNVSSIMGFSGGGLYPNISYQTTKGAIVNMTRALAVEWAGHGIRVNGVAPTYVRTPFTAGLLAQPVPPLTGQAAAARSGTAGTLATVARVPVVCSHSA